MEEAPTAPSSLSSLLPLALTPTFPVRERAVGYRQWRVLRDEKNSGPISSASSRTPADFELVGVLGEGNYSQVLHAVLKATQNHYALKVIDKAKVKRYKKEDEVLVERWVLRNMIHPSIVQMYHAFQEMSALYLSLEMMPGGELWAITHRCGLPSDQARFYAAQMLEVLQFLHERDVVHRDVKPENVLLTADGHVKVIDFGTAKLLRQPIRLGANDEDPTEQKKDRRTRFKEFVGTAEYMAPEAINNKFATSRADLWSFGAFVAQIVTGHPIFKGGSDYLTFKRVLARKYQFFEGTPPLVVDLVDKLCALEPNERLGGAWSAAAEAVDPATIDGQEPRVLGHATLWEHPYFAGLPRTQLHRHPVPKPSEHEMALNELVRKIGTEGLPSIFGSSAAEHAAAIAGWSESYKLDVAFEVRKRELLTQELRDILGMGPPPPPIVDDLSEEMGGAGMGGEDEGDGPIPTVPPSDNGDGDEPAGGSGDGVVV